MEGKTFTWAGVHLVNRVNPYSWRLTNTISHSPLQILSNVAWFCKWPSAPNRAQCTVHVRNEMMRMRASCAGNTAVVWPGPHVSR